MNELIGKVFLVGAGPGDPGLITLRGAECLRAADVVLYDYLASPQLLAAAPPRAELICLGRHGYGRMMSQTEINDAMIRHARAGRRVVRLKGGDPTIFARLAEELTALEAAGVPYEIVPGITAAQAASSHAGIPLTQRDEASCVAIITGQESTEKKDSLDYAALAGFPGTLVFYMGVTTAPVWSQALIAAGKQPDTAVALVRRASHHDQETRFSTLAEVGELVRREKLRPPAVIIVGEVARPRAIENWFTARPLFGRTIMVTRPEHQSQDLAHELERLGAHVLCQPAIEIAAPRDWSAVDAAIARLDAFDWLVFSSANGVRHFFDRLYALGYDARRLGKAKLAAIGPATVAALQEIHLHIDVSPNIYRAEAIAGALAPNARGKRFLLLRASRGREVLAEMLTAAGAAVEQVVVYESRDVSDPVAEIAAALFAGKIDWTTVTSSAIARSLVGLFGDSLHKTRLAAISPLTAEVLAELGHPAAATADSYTADGVVTAILDADLQSPRKL